MMLSEAVQTQAAAVQSVHAQTIDAVRLALAAFARIAPDARTWREEQAMQALSAALEREEGAR